MLEFISLKILNIKIILYQDDVYIFLHDERNALIFAQKFGSFECLKMHLCISMLHSGESLLSN